MSAADELHAGDPPVAQAVMAVLQGLLASANIRPEHLRGRVMARLSMLQDRLPHRPPLDAILQKARPTMTWDEQDSAYVGQQDLAHRSTLPSRRPTRHDIGKSRIGTSPLALALGESPVFRALQVPEGRGDVLARSFLTGGASGHAGVIQFVVESWSGARLGDLDQLTRLLKVDRIPIRTISNDTLMIIIMTCANMRSSCDGKHEVG